VRVKFLCDRCKTRYSIGDERVRGKILKIRCKNCANVITVREGMTDVEASTDSGPARRGRSTTGAPAASTAGSAALGAAFAKQMTKPPPALEEEWYVSIDGDQAGPFSLSEAQRWVASKPFEAELHCWSEGFDDWLSVDKVSHFRGLRRRPAPPSVPPPLPRVAPKRPQPAVAAAPARVEDTPKPLFAATMAALERSVEQASPRANGTGTASALSTPIPSIAKGNTGPLSKLPASPSTMKGPGVRGPTSQGMGAGAKALAEAFEVRPDPADSATAIDAPAFNDEIVTNAEPVSGKRTFDMLQDVARPKATPTAPAESAAPLMDEDDLQIGEVSRVVKLADIAKMAQDRASPRVRTGRTASTPKFPASEIPGALAPVAAGVPGMASVAPPILASESVVAAPLRIQRRGLYMLLGAAALLIAGVVVAVAVLFSNNDGDEPTALREQQQYDTNRPDDPQKPRNALEAVASTGALGSSVAPKIIRRPQQFTQRQPEQPEIPGDPTKSKLRAEEIEDMASKQGDGTKRCYMRAQKGALGLDVGDVKKIDVMLTVDREGAVTDVTLSDHAGDLFGKCLIARIKGWKFRQSPGGVFKIALAFSAG
jgi:predicted Zn finger-like uncharacterized protein